MKKGMKRMMCLLILSVFLLESLTGCRHSPLLEQKTYIPKTEETEPDNNIKEKEEKPDPEVRYVQSKTIPQGAGNTEYGAGKTGTGEGLLQVVTDGGIIVDVPESMYMVTTVSEATQNAHWKTSISYDDDRYTGNRLNGVFEGRGNYAWSDGEKYAGEWRNGMFEGRGTYQWINGDRYDGEWKTEVFEGWGIYTWASGSKYEGEWKAGVKEGQGTYTWANGDQYVGEWKAGVKEGLGAYTWADGSVYEGEWKYGVKEGEGTYRGADGTIYQGLWSNDKFVQ